MTAVEAQAAGRPVIALRAGGALESVSTARRGCSSTERTWTRSRRRWRSLGGGRGNRRGPGGTRGGSGKRCSLPRSMRRLSWRLLDDEQSGRRGQTDPPDQLPTLAIFEEATGIGKPDTADGLLGQPRDWPALERPVAYSPLVSSPSVYVR